MTYSNTWMDIFLTVLPNSYPSGQDLCRFTRELTPSLIPTLDDLAIDTIDNAFGMGNESEWQTVTSLDTTKSTDIICNMLPSHHIFYLASLI